MEAVETRVSKSRFSGIKGTKKEPRLLEKSSTSYLGQDAGSSSLATRTIKAERAFALSAFIFRMAGDSNDQMQESGGLLLAAGWTAATP